MPLWCKAATDPFRTFKVQILQRLFLVKRVFKIDIETCSHCGGAVKIIAIIEDPAVVKRILDHLACRAESTQPLPHPARGPPSTPQLHGY